MSKATPDRDARPVTGDTGTGRDFVRTIIDADVEAGRHGEIVTRFPPEPNGFLHIGHAKAICLDFGIAAEYGGHCNLRFDDTNPETEDPRYVAAIKQDVRWLGFDWGEHEYYASDYFEQLYAWAVELIRKGKAYVDELSDEEIRQYRGTVTESGRDSPYRDRSVADNLALFERMRAGELPPGSHVLRAKIDMAHPNMKMRDPLMYRVRHEEHYRRGNDWKVYPFYDWAHGQSDAIEGVTHSLCTLEFENNRELYDWYLDNLDGVSRPRQYEFARLNVDYTITSKRKLLQLVEGGHVEGWDDPRMPTLAGLRRRGVTPESIRRFCDLVGVAKSESRVDVGMLEYAVRDDLNPRAPRVLCVLRPLEVVITNYPEDRVEELEAPHWPHDIPKEGSRQLPFGRRLYVERDDFMQDPPRDFFRLSPGAEVRLRYAYVIRCDEVIKNDAGEVVQLRCSYDPDTRGGATADGRKVRGTIHWVAARAAATVRVRLYDRLFAVPEPGAGGRDFIDDLNPQSLVEIDEAVAEPGLATASPGAHFQFERQGYFYADPIESAAGAPVFNRVVTLRDSWAKVGAGAPDPRAREPEPPPGRDQESAARRRRKRSGVDRRAAARAADVELAARLARYQSELGLAEADADVLSGDADLAAFFEAALVPGVDPGTVAKWTLNEVARRAAESGVGSLPFAGAEFGRLLELLQAGRISARGAREVVAVMAREGGDPAAIIEQHGLDETLDRSAVSAALDEVVAANADKFAALRQGRQGLQGFFVGQVMQCTGGKADPRLVQELLAELLEAAG